MKTPFGDQAPLPQSDDNSEENKEPVDPDKDSVFLLSSGFSGSSGGDRSHRTTLGTGLEADVESAS